MSDPQASWTSRARHLLSVTSRFALCAACAWLAALLLELANFDFSFRRTPPRIAYLSELALACSLLWLPIVGVLHVLRNLLRTRVRSPDALLCLLIASALAFPSQRSAQLLTGGAGMLDFAGEVPLQLALTLVLIAGYVAVWIVHLGLCTRVRESDSGIRSRFTRRFQRFGRPIAFALGAAALVAFAIAVDQKLRTYAFLVSFVMPGAWLFGASLWFGLLIRSPVQPTWTTLSVAFVLGGAAYALDHETPVRHAKAELGRRGGLAALSEAASRFAPPPRDASLSLDRPEQFRCPLPPSPPASGPTLLTIEREQRRNVIFISVDSLRRDALGRRFEDGTPVTPNLDTFAANSLVFERAVTPYPATLFALGGTLTGLYPSELLLAPPALSDVVQLTAASWDLRVAVWPDVVWFRRSALPKLITRNLEPTLQNGAEQQTTLALQALRLARAANKRTFAWIHYYEPHQTLKIPRREFSGRVRDRYDALVHEVDQQIGRLFDELAALGYLQDSLIAVFGDHGEALGELGYYGHHVYLNHFIGDIPLMIHAPKLAPARSVRAASLTDLAPTVLEWAGVEAPELATDAQSLFRLAASTGERYTVSEAFPVRGRLLYDLVRDPVRSLDALRERFALVRSGSVDYQPKVALSGSRYRLIVNRATGDEEFYDRAGDRTEQNELSEQELPEQAQMRAELAAAIRRMSERIHCRVAALPSAPQAGARDVP